MTDKYAQFSQLAIIRCIGTNTVIDGWHFEGGEQYENLVWKTQEYNKPTKEEFEAAVTAEENARPLQMLRMVRDAKLAETDFWVLGDTAAATQAQLDYRQALRDITNTYTSLDDVVWPAKPE